LALFTQMFQVKQDGQTLMISPLKTLSPKQLELFLEITDTRESDNPW